MKIERLFVFILACLPLMGIMADNNEDVKKKLNNIKKSSLYLYGEATAETEEEARELAEEILYDEINSWAAGKKKLQNSANFAVNNTQTLWSIISLPRGNMFRSFIYVKKSDIIPVENSEVISNTNVYSEDSDVEPSSTSVKKIPECVGILMQYTDYYQFAEQIKQMKAEGKIKNYARYGQLENGDVCYLAIYNKAGKVVAILSPGKQRRNIATGKTDGIINYSGHGAIGFEVNE